MTHTVWLFILIFYGQDTPPKVHTDITVTPSEQLCEEMKKDAAQRLRAGKNVHIFTECKPLDLDKARAVLRGPRG